MKKNIFLLLILASSLFAGFTGSVQITGVRDFGKPIAESFHVNDKPVRVVGTIDYLKRIDDFSFNVRISNKLDDTYLQRLSVDYTTRKGNHILEAEVGTVDTYQGVFSESYLATQQSPFIFKNHGMYNDEFLAGWLDTTVGAQLTYKYIQDCTYMYTIAFTYSKARELSQDRAEGAFYGYESKYVDLDYGKWIKSVDLKFEYLNKITVFANRVHVLVGTNPTANTPTDLTSKYMQYLTEGDSSIFVPSTPFDILVERGGLIYENTDFLASIEGFRMYLENSDLDVKYKTQGSATYLAWYATDKLTIYTSYGESTNTRSSRRYEEKILGARYTIKKNVTVLGEVKKSNWLQHKTFQEHKSYLGQKDRDITTAALQLIVEF